MRVILNIIVQQLTEMGVLSLVVYEFPQTQSFDPCGQLLNVLQLLGEAGECTHSPICWF